MKKNLIKFIALPMIIIPIFLFGLSSFLYADESYNIGNTGPAGGIIFYKSGSHYLEAAPSDMVKTFYFSNVTDLAIGTTGTAIGMGQANTNAIIGQIGHTMSAALVCDNYALSGYTDWFLPSLDELNLMYTNLHLKGLGGFLSGYWYYSSSESTARDAWQIAFDSGMVEDWPKSLLDRVRAIRAFSVSEEEPAWVRTMPMTCWQVFINEDNNFEFIFWYLYKDNNWVRIYDMEGNMVYEVDMPINDPHIIVDLPNGMYTVKTFHEAGKIIQEFIIGKP